MAKMKDEDFKRLQDNLATFLTDAKKNGNFFVFAVSDAGETTEGFSMGVKIEHSRVAALISKLPKSILGPAIGYAMTNSSDATAEEDCLDEDCPVHGKKDKEAK